MYKMREEEKQREAVVSEEFHLNPEQTSVYLTELYFINELEDLVTPDIRSFLMITI